MRLISYSLAIILLVGSLLAQQSITLSTPVQARTGASEFELNSFSFDHAGKQMVIGFREVGGDRSMTFTYLGADFDNGLDVPGSVDSRDDETLLGRKVGSLGHQLLQ